MADFEKNSLPPGLLFSVAGARGIVGESLNADIVSRLTMAFSAVLPEGAIAVGRDTRPSGESLKLAVLDAVMVCGRDAVDLGIATTPSIEMAVEKLEASGGIIISASHNPEEWNALKFLDDRGTFIDKAVGAKLYNIFSSGSPAQVKAKDAGVLHSYGKSAEDHIDAILSLDEVNPALIKKRNFKVAIDCINGAGSVIAPKLLSELGAQLVKVNCKKDGDFGRDPEPRPENLGDFSRIASREGAEIGFALDPDADRLSLVDPRKGAISEEYTLALSIDYILSHKVGRVVVNLSTSSIIERIAESHGASVERTPIGEAHVVKAMMDSGSVIGGEGNGGVILPALHYGRDGLLAMALILQFMAQSGRSLSELINDYPTFFIAKKKVPLDGDFDVERIKDLIKEGNLLRIDTRDGVKAMFQEGWYHLRVSNTEGVVRIIAEAGTEKELEKLLQEAKDVLVQSWAR